MAREHIIEFDYGGMLTIDRMGVEREVGTARYRAFYNENGSKADITRIDRLEYGEWIRDDLGHELRSELEADLAKQMRREEEARVAVYDEERRRFG